MNDQLLRSFLLESRAIVDRLRIFVASANADGDSDDVDGVLAEVRTLVIGCGFLGLSDLGREAQSLEAALGDFTSPDRPLESIGATILEDHLAAFEDLLCDLDPSAAVEEFEKGPSSVSQAAMDDPEALCEVEPESPETPSVESEETSGAGADERQVREARLLARSRDSTRQDDLTPSSSHTASLPLPLPPKSPVVPEVFKSFDDLPAETVDAEQETGGSSDGIVQEDVTPAPMPLALYVPEDERPLARIAAIVESSHPDAVPPEEKSAVSSGTLRVLHVDESLFYRELVRAALEAEGFDVVTAEEPAVAIAFLEAGEPIDAVVGELEFSSADGCEMAEEIRTHPTLSEIPLLALVQRTDEVRVVAAISSGFDAVVLKYRTSDLVENLLAVTATRSQPVAA